MSTSVRDGSVRRAGRQGLAGLLRRVYRGWVDDSLGDTAAALTYYGILSVFPGLLLLVAILGLLLNQHSTGTIVDTLARLGPNTAVDVISKRLVAVERTSSLGLLVLGLAGTLFGTTEAVVTLMEALNRCYVVRETRRFWTRWAIALATTAVGAVAGLVAVTAIFATPLLAPHLGGRGALVLRWLRLPCAALSVTTLWAFLYWALPNRKARFRLFTPGAIVGAALWVAASLALSADSLNNKAKSITVIFHSFPSGHDRLRPRAWDAEQARRWTRRRRRRSRPLQKLIRWQARWPGRRRGC